MITNWNTLIIFYFSPSKSIQLEMANMEELQELIEKENQATRRYIDKSLDAQKD